MGASGVLAAVTAGVYLGWRAPELASSETRLQGFSFWTITVFLLNATLFVLIGLQLPLVLDALSDRPAAELIGYGAAVSAVVIATRFAWVFGITVIVRALDRRPAQRARRGTWQARTLVAWAGMRGAVSLAAALAVPVTTDAGEPFPGRDLILFITFCVILATLVFQGLTLPALIRVLGVRDDAREEGDEELHARLAAATAALERIDELGGEGWVRPDTLARNARGLRVAPAPLRGPGGADRGRRPRLRGAVTGLPAGTAGGDRGPAPGAGGAAQPWRDLERGDAQDRA